jgi:hypothetical protein
MNTGSIARIAGGIALIGGAALVVDRLALRPRYTNWGATDEEIERAMPGDDMIANPAMASTYAITVEARPEDIWPWLMQIGYKRGGFYSYEWIERSLGVPMENVDRILPEYQELRPGDMIPLGPEGPHIPVVAVAPNRSLLLGGYDPVEGGATWAWGLYPIDERSTRLVTRFRMQWLDSWTLQGHFTSLTALRTLPMYLFFEPGAFLMVRKMLLGIKERAETIAPMQLAIEPLAL